jgi:hypothetical protein
MNAIVDVLGLWNCRAMMNRIVLLLFWASLSVAAAPREIVLLNAKQLTSEVLADKFAGVALVVDESTVGNDIAQAVTRISQKKLELYYWIEVGRNPIMAEAHPEWMGSIGMHEDWMKRFPAAKQPGKGQVAKAFPWVPITAKAAFDAHVKRAARLVEGAPKEFRGIILNDLQGPPGSCGCGNLQCRWAVDYHVPATSEQSSADDAAARFVAAVRTLLPGKDVVPVWTTECEDQDLPAKHRAGKETTGYCGDVGCAIGACPKEFARQWGNLTREHAGPIGLLTVHREFQRANTDWISQSLAYAEKIGGKSVARSNLWLVVQGKDEKEERAARELAARSGVGATVVARVQIDQSYSPRLVVVKQGAASSL